MFNNKLATFAVFSSLFLGTSFQASAKDCGESDPKAVRDAQELLNRILKVTDEPEFDIYVDGNGDDKGGLVPQISLDGIVPLKRALPLTIGDWKEPKPGQEGLFIKVGEKNLLIRGHGETKTFSTPGKPEVRRLVGDIDFVNLVKDSSSKVRTVSKALPIQLNNEDGSWVTYRLDGIHFEGGALKGNQINQDSVIRVDSNCELFKNSVRYSDVDAAGNPIKSVVPDAQACQITMLYDITCKKFVINRVKFGHKSVRDNGTSSDDIGSH